MSRVLRNRLVEALGAAGIAATSWLVAGVVAGEPLPVASSVVCVYGIVWCIVGVALGRLTAGEEEGP